MNNKPYGALIYHKGAWRKLNNQRSRTMMWSVDQWVISSMTPYDLLKAYDEDKLKKARGAA